MMSPPLEEKYLDFHDPKTGKCERIPALDPRWASAELFVRFQPVPKDLTDAGELGLWSERCSFIEEDLDLLLRTPHHKFWCSIIFNQNIQECIDSFLQYAPRAHDRSQDLPRDVKSKLGTLYGLFFMVCLRMTTYKESKDTHITPKVFGEILYENFIFHIPRIMDLCVLFRQQNRAILTKMVTNIFEQQPKYTEDLRCIVPCILEIFHNIQEKCGLRVEGSMSPQKLTDGGISKGDLSKLPVDLFKDIILYFADTSASLWAFLDIYPAGALLFHEHEFPLKLVQMYEQLVPRLNDALETREWPNPGDEQHLAKRLRCAQRDLLHVFRQIVFQSSLQPAIESKNQEEIENGVEDFINLMTSLHSEIRFAADYDYLFPVEEDLDMITQTSYTIDETRQQFVRGGFLAAQAARKQRNRSARRPKTGHSMGFGAVGAGSIELAESFESPDQVEDHGACAPSVTGVELESLITSVKDLLPHLGEGFIELCLEEFGFDVERTINSLLEEKLPASLKDIDRSLSRQRKPLTEDDVLSQRANIYDNDEFDVFNRKDVDMSRIHRGKKDKNLQMSLLDDKAELSPLRPLFDRYANEEVASMYDKTTEYDDEYDDTYDDHNVGADDADDADELRDRRAFVVPRILQTTRQRDQGDSAEEVEEENEDDDRRDEFIEDPAKIRERQAQRRAARDARQGKRPPGQQEQGQGQFDTKGKPKGQGQDSSVLRNRNFKEKNKATRVHHNRKVLSDKKRKV